MVKKDSDKGKLLVFHHGLGDVILFLPLYEYLNQKENYTVAFQAGCGFTPLLDRSIETPGGDFDYGGFCKEERYDSYKIVDFWSAEGSGITKTELCARNEFGIEDFSAGIFKLNLNPRIVGVNFHSTCLPEENNPDEKTALKIWNEIKGAGFLPLEIHFEHMFHNSVNRKFDFIENSSRGIGLDIRLLVKMLENCAAFIGVLAGVWVTATAVMNVKNICALEKAFLVTDYMKRSEIVGIDINKYQDGSVKSWLDIFN